MRAIRFRFVVSFLAVGAACGDNKTLQPDASVAQCADGIDNDADGMIDFPSDLGCESQDDDSENSAPAPACDDDRDNDGDGKIDFPEDPGCTIAAQDSEDDDCPSGPDCPQCADEIDNDGNGKIDFPSDPQCTAASDVLEFPDNPVACGVGTTIEMLPASGTATGTLTPASTSGLASACGAVNVQAYAYAFYVPQPSVVVATTDLPATTIDTVLDLRSSMCSDASASRACNDDITTDNLQSKITHDVPAGVYYLIVRGKDADVTGPYGVEVDLFPGEGTPCTSQADCGPGLQCRIPSGSTMMVC